MRVSACVVSLFDRVDRCLAAIPNWLWLLSTAQRLFNTNLKIGMACAHGVSQTCVDNRHSPRRYLPSGYPTLVVYGGMARTSACLPKMATKHICIFTAQIEHLSGRVSVVGSLTVHYCIPEGEDDLIAALEYLVVYAVSSLS